MIRRSLFATVALTPLVSPVLAEGFWHAPQVGVAWSMFSYGNSGRGAAALAEYDALHLAGGAATNQTIDSVISDDSADGNFGLTLSYDLTRYLTLEANYFALGGGAEFAALGGSTVILYGTAARNGEVQPFNSYADVAVQWYGAALLGYYPIWRGLSAMGRAGFEHTRTETSNIYSYAGQPCVVNNHDATCGAIGNFHTAGAARNVPQFGVGLAYRWQDWGKVSLEYQRLTTSVGDAQTGRYSMSAICFEVSVLPAVLIGHQ